MESQGPFWILVLIVLIFPSFQYFPQWLVSLLINNLICSPGNPSLMGLNIGGGSEVKLRLRRSNNELDFFPYTQILDTMLHELCHNEYGPHNTQFYNLLDEIRKVVAFLAILCSYLSNFIYHCFRSCSLLLLIESQRVNYLSIQQSFGESNILGMK